MFCIIHSLREFDPWGGGKRREQKSNLIVSVHWHLASSCLRLTCALSGVSQRVKVALRAPVYVRAVCVCWHWASSFICIGHYWPQFIPQRRGTYVHFLKFCSGSFLGSLVLVMQETWVQSLGWEDTLEKGMATHSSILAWRIPWTDEPGGLQLSMGSRRVRHNLSN